MNEWKIIISDKDLDDRVGEHDEPRLINQEIINCKSKKDAISKYEKLINKYIDKCYDWKGHSEGAMKFYYEENNKDILTVLLLYHNGQEVQSGIFT